jgi:two-component system, NtrC family, response regulator AtoC
MVLWPGGWVTHPLGAAPVLVGRAQECDVHADEPSVSRRHVVIHPGVGGASATVEDLGGSNGTRVSGRRLAANERAVLAPGELVEMGKAILVLQTTSAPRAASTWDAPTIPHADRGAQARVRTAEIPMARLPGAPVHGDTESVTRLVDLVAASTLSVVLLGETGAGKEVTAARIHAGSPRRAGPFVRINCAALAETLLESELFGHERGAFTGAVKTKTGLLESAHGGTVLLDEVGEMPLATQAKLLRVLESREVMRVGSVETRVIDVRIVAATNRDLPAFVAAGGFRSDLYFRLNGITIRVPPLRERRDEILPLARTFLAQASQGRPAAFTPAALSKLESYAWPGNVRELRNVVERALVLSGGSGVIDSQHLSVESMVFVSPQQQEQQPVAVRRAAQTEPPPGMSLRADVEDFERKRIEQALAEAHGNQTRAAELLGISRRTLVSRLDAFDMPRPRKNRVE